jgi:glycosyltransferase involved in cell wall biosynthesis
MGASWVRQPLLTIVTINRNNAAQLERTLASFVPLRRQPELEFVFVDGLSSDDSLAVAARFYAPHEVASEADRGVFHAMNKGLRRSRGRYVLWINSGDMACTNLLNQLLCFQQNHALIAFAVEVARADSVVEKVCWPSLERMPDGMIVHQGMALHRQTLLELGGYNERWRYTADFDVLLRLHLARASMVCVSEVISRFHLGGLSSDLRAVARERLEILWANRAIRRRAYLYRRLRHHLDGLALAWRR